MPAFNLRRRVVTIVLALLGGLGLAVPSAVATPQTKQSSCSWDDGFTVSGLDGEVYAIATQQTPEGTRIFVGGSFRAVDGVLANHVAQWQQGRWDVLEGPEGVGVDDTVRALAVWDDGTGLKLYVGGDFTKAGSLEAHHMARWDGQAWSALGPGDSPGLTIGEGPLLPPVTAMLPFDDGAGAGLFVTGGFVAAGGALANGLAKWDGSQWSAPVGPSTPASGSSLLVWNDGSGDALYVDISKLANGELIRLPGPDPQLEGRLTAAAVWDDGSGPGFYIAVRPYGGFPNTSYVAKWTDADWLEIGRTALRSSIWSLLALDTGHGSKLVAAGDFRGLGEVEADLIATYDGESWTALGDAMVPGLEGKSVQALGVADIAGTKLIVGGGFTAAAGEKAPNLAFWNESGWSPPASAVPDLAGILGAVYSIVEWDDGTGLTTYVGGEFLYASGERVNHIAKWQSGRWVPLRSSTGDLGVSAYVGTLAVWNDGSGEALYVGGGFQTAGGLVVPGIARWDGHDWSGMQGSQPLGTYTNINDLVVWDDGTGSALYAAGRFPPFGTYYYPNVVKWDGQEWTPLGEPIDLFRQVYALSIWDDGTGESLYAGGSFTGTTSEQVFVARIARWDGSSWHSADPDLFNLFEIIYDLKVSNFEGSSMLYSAGMNGVKRYDGHFWSYVGIAEDLVTTSAYSLGTWNDGSGNALYAGRYEPPYLQRWDGNSWADLTQPAGSGPDGSVLVLHALSQEPSLLVGGEFTVAGGLPSAGIGQLTCTSPCEADPDHLLCLGGDRFVVDIDWRDFEGHTGTGRVVPFQTDRSGLFYFFGENNWEVLVKVLDGCSINNNFWVFSAASTSVEYTLTVTDTASGTSKSYFNPLGVAAPAVTDTSAFSTCTAGTEGLAAPSTALETPSKTVSIRPSAAKTACVASDTALCLRDSRFQVEIDWRDFEGHEGTGKVVPDTPADGSGLFQFFGPNNWEVLVKVLDGCTLNDRYWVFAAATTNVEYTMRVTDTTTGETREYFNPLGVSSPAVTDTDAFATCP